MTPVADEGRGERGIAGRRPAAVEDLEKQNEALQRQVDSLTRRRDSLLGERSVFERLLADREQRIGVLLREMGRPRRPLQAWLDRCTREVEAWLRRPPTMDRDRRTGGRPPAPALPATPATDLPLVPFALDGRSPRVIAVAVFGLSTEALEKVVEDVQAGLSGKLDIVPLFLVGGPDFEVFRRRHLLFEYLPSPEHQRPFLPDLDWETYRLRRLALLRRIWQPARILAVGPKARAVLEQWLDSPFEDETITSVIHRIANLEMLP